MKMIVALHNIRSTYNVGAILRTMDGFGVEKAIFSGYTPRVNDERLLPHLREKLNHQIEKTALGAEKTVPIVCSEDIYQTLKDLKSEGWKIVGLENNIDDARLYRLDELKLDTEKAVLLLGEEVDGISADLYDLIDVFAEIPMQGQKESFNVSVAAGIAMWEISKR